MKVTIKDAAGRLTLLGDVDESIHIPSFLPSEERDVQIVRPIDADNVTIIPRGQRVISFSFDATHQHDDYQEALIFVCSHFADVPTQGTLEFLMNDTSGSARKTLAGACVRSVQCVENLGVHTRWRYSIVAPGPFSA